MTVHLRWQIDGDEEASKRLNSWVSRLRDPTPAFDEMMDHLASVEKDWFKTKGGGTLFLGPKVYRIASPVVVNGATIRLQGAGFTEGPGPGQGTWLRITTTGCERCTLALDAARFDAG